MKLNNNDLIKIKGGSIAISTINGVLKALEPLFNLGRSLVNSMIKTLRNNF